MEYLATQSAKIDNLESMVITNINKQNELITAINKLNDTAKKIAADQLQANLTMSSFTKFVQLVEVDKKLTETEIEQSKAEPKKTKKNKSITMIGGEQILPFPTISPSWLKGDFTPVYKTLVEDYTEDPHDTAELKERQEIFDTTKENYTHHDSDENYFNHSVAAIRLYSSKGEQIINSKCPDKICFENLLVLYFNHELFNIVKKTFNKDVSYNTNISNLKGSLWNELAQSERNVIKTKFKEYKGRYDKQFKEIPE